MNRQGRKRRRVKQAPGKPKAVGRSLPSVAARKLEKPAELPKANDGFAFSHRGAESIAFIGNMINPLARSIAESLPISRLVFDTQGEIPTPSRWPARIRRSGTIVVHGPAPTLDRTRTARRPP